MSSHLNTMDDDDEGEWVWNNEWNNMRTLDSELRCILCKEIFRSAMILRTCGHSFCSVCLRGQIESNNKCPTCRGNATIHDIKPNFNLSMAANAFLTVRKTLIANMREIQTLRANTTTTTTTTGTTGRSSRNKKKNIIDNDSDYDDNHDDDDYTSSQRNKGKTNRQTNSKSDTATSTSTGQSTSVTSSSTSSLSTKIPVSHSSATTGFHTHPALSRMGPVVYHLCKDKDLREMLMKLNLPTTGTREMLIWRHRNYATYLNSAIDSYIPGQPYQTTKDIIKTVLQLEKERDEDKSKLASVKREQPRLMDFHSTRNNSTTSQAIDLTNEPTTGSTNSSSLSTTDRPIAGPHSSMVAVDSTMNKTFAEMAVALKLRNQKEKQEKLNQTNANHALTEAENDVTTTNQDTNTTSVNDGLPPVPPTDLGPNYIALWSQKIQKFFFFNTDTREGRWTHPHTNQESSIITTEEPVVKEESVAEDTTTTTRSTKGRNKSTPQDETIVTTIPTNKRGRRGKMADISITEDDTGNNGTQASLPQSVSNSPTRSKRVKRGDHNENNNIEPVTNTTSTTTITTINTVPAPVQPSKINEIILTDDEDNTTSMDNNNKSNHVSSEVISSTVTSTTQNTNTGLISTTWSCNVCTFLNRSRTKKCEMCGNGRP